MSALFALMTRHPVASGLGAAAFALLLALGAQTVRLSLAASRIEVVQAQYDREAQRAVNAIAQVQSATAGLRQAEAINRRQAEALSRQSTAIAGLRTEADRQARVAADRERQVLEQLAAVRQQDSARRARPDLPPAAEMTRVLREAVQGL